jgi:hypothetical protein
MVPTIRRLRLSSSAVTDAGFASVSRLAELRSISLQFTAITGQGILHLSQCRHLSQLVCNPSVNCRQAAVAIGTFPAIESLDLECGDWTDEDVANVLKLPNLTDLSLAQNQGISLTRIPGGQLMSPLVRLSCSESAIDDLSCEFIASFRALRELSVEGTSVTDAGIARLLVLRNLEVLRLSETKISHDGIGMLSRFAALRRLDIDDVPMTDDDAERLLNAKQLKWLSAERCGLKRNSMLKIVKDRKWEYLELS